MKIDDGSKATVRMGPGGRSGVRLGGVFELTCRDRDGNIKWEAIAPNLVTTEGLQDILDVYLLSDTQITSWYVGLTDNSPTPAAGDTLASHDGWTEFDEYTGNRQDYTGARSSETVTNSASKASFPITAAGGGVGGAFIASAATGTTGVLLCVAALSGGNRTVAADDTVEVTYTFSAADDGA